ncbi:MAG TPA: ATP-binding cassette domain-containing protein, partial [Acidobacteriota bacterium]|nr:ATP-binding cassette domain-containing protein [Acidobacteriota bacterium]
MDVQKKSKVQNLQSSSKSSIKASTKSQTDIIKIDHVTKYYDAFKALDDITLSIQSKTIVAILGSNGAGKSTTIKLLCGLLKPTKGTITIDGLSYQKNANQIKQSIGYVPEESAL